jgi:ABC-type branched-subunit amino acid transport system substrate-binding protein
MGARMLAVLVLALLLAGCPTDVADPARPPPPPDAVVIGLLQPQPSGLEVQREQAARLAIAEINAAGGVNGRPLALRVAYDNTNDPDTGVSSARLLEAGGVVALIGANASRVTLPVAEQVTIPAGLALISPGSTSPLISTLADNDTVYRIPPSDALQGRLLAELVWDEGRTQVAIFGQDDPYGQGLREAFTTRFVELGGSIQAEAVFPTGRVSGYGAEISALYASGTPTAIMLFAFAEQTSNLLREIVAAKGGLPPLYGVDANMSQITLQNSPAQIAGMRGTVPSSPLGSAAYAIFRQAFVNATRVMPEPNRENSYDAVYLIALALARAGVNDRAAVATHLREVSRPDGPAAVTVLPGGFAGALAALQGGADIDYEGASGPIDFDASGDPAAATYQYLEVQLTAGGFELVTLQTIAYP